MKCKTHVKLYGFPNFTGQSKTYKKKGQAKAQEV